MLEQRYLKCSLIFIMTCNLMLQLMFRVLPSSDYYQGQLLFRDCKQLLLCWVGVSGHVTSTLSRSTLAGDVSVQVQGVVEHS